VVNFISWEKQVEILIERRSGLMHADETKKSGPNAFVKE